MDDEAWHRAVWQVSELQLGGGRHITTKRAAAREGPKIEGRSYVDVAAEYFVPGGVNCVRHIVKRSHRR